MSWPEKLKKGITKEEHFGRSLWVYEERPRNISEFINHNVKLFPEKEALVCNNTMLTYKEFQEKVNILSYQLSSSWGVKKGDRVAVLFDNSIEFCVSIFAICQLGAIAVTLNTRLKPAELEFMLIDSNAKILLMSSDYWNNIEKILDKLVAMEQVFISGEIPLSDKVLSYEDLFGIRDYHVVKADIEEEDVAFIVYTSGTTGKPKGAMVTHLNVIHSCINYQRVMELSSNDRTLVAVPLFHITGMVAQLLLFVFIGGTITIMRDYKTQKFIQLMSQSRATHTIVVPTIYILMLMNEEIDDFDLSSWRVAAYGGAPISSETVSQLTSKFPNLQPFNCYGATETTSPSTISPPWGCLKKPSSVGLPVPVGEITICDEKGTELGANQVGEIWIKGPMVVPGYWNNPEANNKEFTRGFWHSGDMGQKDDEGFIYVMDRKKDLINRGGEKIFCVEVEDVISSHPKAMEVAVVGVPDKVFGEQVKAVIVPKPGTEVTGEEIQEFASEKLAHYKVPKYVEFVDILPKNPGGKVLKQQLKETEV